MCHVNELNFFETFVKLLEKTNVILNPPITVNNGLMLHTSSITPLSSQKTGDLNNNFETLKAELRSIGYDGIFNAKKLINLIQLLTSMKG